jgi:hypothetical protein
VARPGVAVGVAAPWRGRGATGRRRYRGRRPAGRPQVEGCGRRRPGDAGRLGAPLRAGPSRRPVPPRGPRRINSATSTGISRFPDNSRRFCPLSAFWGTGKLRYENKFSKKCREKGDCARKGRAGSFRRHGPGVAMRASGPQRGSQRPARSDAGSAAPDPGAPETACGSPVARGARDGLRAAHGPGRLSRAARGPGRLSRAARGLGRRPGHAARYLRGVAASCAFERSSSPDSTAASER